MLCPGLRLVVEGFEETILHNRESLREMRRGAGRERPFKIDSLHSSTSLSTLSDKIAEILTSNLGLAFDFSDVLFLLLKLLDAAL